MPEYFIGLMSGTSLDGIDAAVVDLADGVHILHAATHPFPKMLRTVLHELIERPEAPGLDRVGTADALLGTAYADAVNRILEDTSLDRGQIIAIGCHGQTIRHRTDTRPAFSWQLGDPNRIAAETGLVTVADFRRMDIALGGEGAPLVPAFHAAMFSNPGELRAVINIGGIANITRLGPTVTGYDIGPGNVLMDAWIRHQRKEEYDRNGAWAASGAVNEELLAELSADPFFRKPPPRSTGREYFNLDWLVARIANKRIAPEDVQATLTALTVEAIAREVKRSEAERALVCGGGARNHVLLEALRVALGDVPLETTDEHGLDADFVEAAAFAWLARERLAGRPGNLASVTGASRPAILGGVYLPAAISPAL